ncbi:hypothetical protein GCM10023205_61680 [Yinghuangia aomiensis]|uniref:Uncharacterized protein n=1 Tax=Yinghuangia aomiensis TaxID=676205 RepID=A0ABP9I0L8_9ACTN
MTAPYDHGALWVKAKLFINRAMDEDSSRTFDEKALWAALALELLAKSALSRVSPLLIAEPTEDGGNLLIASGLVEGDARFISVRAKTLFARCQRAFKPFNLKEASIITSARNEYLHGSAVGFLAVPSNVWWARYWAQASILVNALDRDIEEFVGDDREPTVMAHLDQNAKNVEHRTEMLIERAKQRLSQHLDGTLPARIAAEWKPGLDRSIGFTHRGIQSCPACGSNGTIEGDDITDTSAELVQVDEEDYEVIVNIIVAAEYFSCRNCQLVLDRYELIEQAGLPTTFETEGDSEDYREPEYGND